MPPVALMLFGGRLSLDPKASLVLIDDGWLRFRVSADVAALILRLRNALEETLARKIRAPALDLHKEGGAALIDGVVKLLASEASWEAAEACMQCHDDDHTNNFSASPHFALWNAELNGKAPAGTGVSCATCHLPRETRTDSTSGTKVEVVQHNQNANLHPNEKMYRGVCMNCHGLGFTIDSLADRKLIEGC